MVKIFNSFYRHDSHLSIDVNDNPKFMVGNCRSKLVLDKYSY
jgi:hypothetical protein